MLNEEFWVFLAFVCFIAISFAFLKKMIISALDNRIKSVEASVLNAEKAKKDSHDMLITLKHEYERTKLQYSLMIKDAQNEAEAIIQNTEQKVLLINSKAMELFEEYKRQSQENMFEVFKADVIITVLKLLESEYKSDVSEQTKSIESSLSNMKKLWN